jgi:hypothetical protein
MEFVRKYLRQDMFSIGILEEVKTYDVYRVRYKGQVHRRYENYVNGRGQLYRSTIFNIVSASELLPVDEANKQLANNRNDVTGKLRHGLLQPFSGRRSEKLLENGR